MANSIRRAPVKAGLVAALVGKFNPFANAEAAAQFMANPHPELDDRAPFEAALTEIGGREVEEVIERGLHGLPA